MIGFVIHIECRYTRFYLPQYHRGMTFIRAAW